MSEIVEKNLSIHNNMAELEKLTHEVSLLIEKQQISKQVGHDLMLVIDELLSNIIKYAYQDNQHDYPIDVSLRVGMYYLYLEIIDAGCCFDLTQSHAVDLSADPEKRQIGGLGIFLVKHLVDSIKYTRCDEKNVLTLEKRYD